MKLSTFVRIPVVYTGSCSTITRTPSLPAFTWTNDKWLLRCWRWRPRPRTQVLIMTMGIITATTEKNNVRNNFFCWVQEWPFPPASVEQWGPEIFGHLTWNWIIAWFTLHIRIRAKIDEKGVNSENIPLPAGIPSYPASGLSTPCRTSLLLLFIHKPFFHNLWFTRKKL